MNAPTGWTTVKVGDVFHVQLGKMLSKKAKEGRAPFKYLGNRHVQWGRIDTSELPMMDYSAAEREKFSLRDGDLLVCEGGEVGRAAIWRGQVNDCYYQKALHRLRPKSDAIMPEYMYRFLQVAAARDMFSGLTSQTSIAHLTKEKLETLELPLPPHPEQKRIAAILDKADEIRRKRAKTIRLTEELLKSAFLEMFGDPVTNPKGWEVRKLGEVCAFVGGGTPARARPEFFTGKIPWATSKDIRGEVFVDSQEHVTEEAVANSATKLVPAGTLLVVVKSKVLMHRLPVTISTVPVCFGQDLKGIVLEQTDLRPEYVLRLLKLSSGVLLPQARGANTEGLTLDHLRNLDIICPPADLIVRYQALSSRVRSILRKNTLRQSDTLVGALTQRAFRGEL